VAFNNKTIHLKSDLKLLPSLGQLRNKKADFSNPEAAQLAVYRVVPLRAMPASEMGYSNKVLELIKHMYSVDHK